MCIRDRSIDDLKAMPLRSPNLKMPTYLSQVADVTQIQTPTEVDHYQLQRTFDVYVAPSGEDIGGPAKAISKIIDATQIPPNIRINVRGLVAVSYTHLDVYKRQIFHTTPLLHHRPVSSSLCTWPNGVGANARGYVSHLSLIHIYDSVQHNQHYHRCGQG